MKLLPAITFLRHFIGHSQLTAMVEGMKGQEGKYFEEILLRFHQRILKMPGTGRNDASNPIVTLRYFHACGFTWHITEKDSGGPNDLPEDKGKQFQAFGWADLGDPEWGYISIQEIIENGGELDLHFEPKPWSEIKK